MARILDLNILVSQPDAYRDAEWEQAFFHALVDGRLKLTGTEAQPGPDGWPYLFAQTAVDATEPAVRILDWLAERGIGLVVNGHKQVADYVFPYGMIWNWKEKRQFITQAQAVNVGAVEWGQGEKVLAGPPSPEFLPAYVRKILAQFLNAQGVKEPRILVISRDRKHYDLCFSLESLGRPPKEEHRGIAEALAWFLPQHYSLMLISEEGLPAFVPVD